MQKSIITKTCPIDFHWFLILIDKFWSITIDFNRVSKISICFFQIMYKSKFIKIRITVSIRQKLYHLWPNIPTPSTGKLKRGHITYQCKGSVGWGQIPCPQANHFSQMHKSFPELISFIRVATVREKSGNFLKSQGTLFSGAMHQGWQWAFKRKIKPLWTFSTWWSFLFWK